MKTWKLAALAVASLAWAGCASTPPGVNTDARLVVPRATANGQPVLMELDTGSGSSWLDEDAARRLGIKTALPATSLGMSIAHTNIPIALSAPVSVTEGNETMTAQFPLLPFSHREDTPMDMVMGWINDLGLDDRRYFDVVIGWPEVRENMLVFNPVRQTVAAADALPAEAAGWLQFKILPRDQLLLEAKAPDGANGEILVDTGSFFGVALPPPQWTAWKHAHPDAIIATTSFYMPSSGAVSAENSFADEIELGGIRLTHVPIREANAAEGVGVDHFLGSIGLAALQRMNLILDGKNGVAYVQPLPQAATADAGGAPPADGSKDWTVEGSVALTTDRLLAGAGVDKALNGDNAGAMTDFNHAIEINPQGADVYTARGIVHYRQGDSASARADFDRVLELDPSNLDAREARATLRQITGDFAGAVADYDIFITQKSADTAYPELYRQVLQMRLGSAPDTFSNTVAGWKDGWTKSLGQFLAGAMDEKSLLKAAERSGDEPANGQKCEAYYFIGMLRLIHGDEAGARDAFKKSVGTDVEDYHEYEFSKAELARLDQAGKQ